MRAPARMDSCIMPRQDVPPTPGPSDPCQERPDCMVLAMAYVPMQKFEDLYNPEVGFDRGTVFRRLDLPYLGEALDPEEVDCRG